VGGGSSRDSSIFSLSIAEKKEKSKRAFSTRLSNLEEIDDQAENIKGRRTRKIFFLNGGTNQSSTNRKGGNTRQGGSGRGQ